MPALAPVLPRWAVAGLLLLTAMPSAHAEITYTLHFDPADAPDKQQIAESVAAVAAFYNEHGSFNKHWNVYHKPGLPTAEGNSDGYMAFGGSRNERVVFHEAAHTFGMGTTGRYHELIEGRVWAGPHANRVQAETYGDFKDGLHGDNHALWPGGFNYDREDGFIERFWHVRIMAAMRADLGYLAFTREASNELAHEGETARFEVEAPNARTFQWFRDGEAVADGGDVSGATTASLSIADAEAADAGSYHCEVSARGESLASRPRQLWVEPKAPLGLWKFNGDAGDRLGRNPARPEGGPQFGPGKYGEAIYLDGEGGFLRLDPDASRARDFTFAAWVYWQGGDAWQRIFDFGSNVHQSIFLTPRSADGKMRFGFEDEVNGSSTQYAVEIAAPPTGRWFHVAAVLDGDEATLYLDGRPAGSASGIPVELTDFLSPRSYFLGKSQHPDPTFKGRLDEVMLFNHALGRAQIEFIMNDYEPAGNQPAA